MGENRPADRAGLEAGAGLATPTGASDLVLLSAWLGLAAGWIEVATRVSLKYALGPGQMYRIMRHFVWAVPLANFLLFLAGGLIAAAAARRWPRSSRWLGCRILLTAAILPPLLLAGRQIYSWAWLLLAAGLAVRVMSRLQRTRIDWRWWGRRTLPALLVPVAVVPGIIVSADWLALARLAAGPLPPAGAPDVLFIVLDTVRADRLSLYGYDRPTSPVLQRLATRGIRFDEARSSAPWTLPSHASFFTGRWPRELGVGWQAPLRTPFPTLAEYVASRGYETAGFVANVKYCSYDAGQRAVSPITRTTLSTRRTSARCGRPSSGGLPGTQRPGRASRPGRTGITRSSDGSWHPTARTPVQSTTSSSAGWTAAAAAVPTLHFSITTTPTRPTCRRRGRRFGSGRARRSERDFLLLVENWNDIDKLHLRQNFADLILDSYENCVAYLDGQLGRLFVELGRRGPMDRTLVIITADHGEELGDHELFEHGESLYRPEVHVPLLFILPSGRFAGSVVRETVSLRDLPATIVELAGLADGSPFPGRSLTRLWRDLRSGHRDFDADDVFSERPWPTRPSPARAGRPPRSGRWSRWPATSTSTSAARETIGNSSTTTQQTRAS